MSIQEVRDKIAEAMQLAALEGWTSVVISGHMPNGGAHVTWHGNFVIALGLAKAADTVITQAGTTAPGLSVPSGQIGGGTN